MATVRLVAQSGDEDDECRCMVVVDNTMPEGVSKAALVTDGDSVYYAGPDTILGLSGSDAGIAVRKQENIYEVQTASGILYMDSGSLVGVPFNAGSAAINGSPVLQWDSDNKAFVEAYLSVDTATFPTGKGFIYDTNAGTSSIQHIDPVVLGTVTDGDVLLKWDSGGPSLTGVKYVATTGSTYTPPAGETTVPTPPPSGTYVLTSSDGSMSWTQIKKCAATSS